MAQLTTLGEVLDHLGTTLGIADAELASAFGVQVRTIERWRSEEAFPQHESRRRLDALDTLATRLEKSFTSLDGIQRWIHSPSGYFGGLMPLDALLRGRVDLVEAALEAMESGVFV